MDSAPHDSIGWLIMKIMDKIKRDCLCATLHTNAASIIANAQILRHCESEQDFARQLLEMDLRAVVAAASFFGVTTEGVGSEINDLEKWFKMQEREGK